MAMPIENIKAERYPVLVGKVLYVPQQAGQACVCHINGNILNIFDIFSNIFRNNIHVWLLSVPLERSIYGYSFDPTFKRSLVIVLANLFKNCDETVVQIVFRFYFVARILEAHTEKNTGVFLVQFSLGCAFSFLTIMYQLIKIQMLVNFGWLKCLVYWPVSIGTVYSK